MVIWMLKQRRVLSFTGFMLQNMFLLIDIDDVDLAVAPFFEAAA